MDILKLFELFSKEKCSDTIALKEKILTLVRRGLSWE